MPLSPRQLRFVDEYVVDLNAKAAAVRAGYSAHTAQQAGSRVARMPQVKAAIAEAMAARSTRTRVTADRVVQEYARMAFSDIRQAVRWRLIASEAGGRGSYEIELVDSGELDDDAGAAVAEVSQAAGGALRVKMHDKKGALDSLARHLGLFLEKAEAR
jgi:phage terminase small subunit